MMKRFRILIFTGILAAILGVLAFLAFANGAKDPLILPDFISFSNGNGYVYLTGHESSADFEIFSYQCQTDHVEAVVQEYIRELRKSGIYISQSEKTVYDSDANDANYGVALRDMNPDRAKSDMKDSSHGWAFEDVSVLIAFSTGGSYDSQYVEISYAKGSYETADTGARMRDDRSFSAADYYYYRDLLTTNEQKEAYDCILAQVTTMENPISLEDIPTHMNYDEFFQVWYSILVDNPQIFTTDDNLITSIEYFSDGGVREFSVQYFLDKKDLPRMNRAYKQAVNEALTVIDPYMTDYEKELALHDWLCKHIRYDYSISKGASTSYAGLVEGLAVCEGYSESFTELLHRAGIEAATVYGFVLPEEEYSNNSHAWNIVCIDGNWYYVDVTWDDDVTPPRYDYFNLTTKQMEVDHVNGIGTFPICNSKDAAYNEEG